MTRSHIYIVDADGRELLRRDNALQQLTERRTPMDTTEVEDAGGDGAVDRVTGARALHTSASLGWSAWASAERIGDEHLAPVGEEDAEHAPGLAAVLDPLL